MTGLFPEYVVSARRVRAVHLDSFADFVKAGKESYSVETIDFLIVRLNRLLKLLVQRTRE